MKFQFKDHSTALSAIARAGFYAFSNGLGKERQKIVPMRTEELGTLELNAKGYLDTEAFRADKTNVLTRVWTDYPPEKRSSIGYLTSKGEVNISKPSGLPGQRNRRFRRNAKDFLRCKLE